MEEARVVGGVREEGLILAEGPGFLIARARQNCGPPVIASDKWFVKFGDAATRSIDCYIVCSLSKSLHRRMSFQSCMPEGTAKHRSEHTTSFNYVAELVVHSLIGAWTMFHALPVLTRSSQSLVKPFAITTVMERVMRRCSQRYFPQDRGATHSGSGTAYH